MTMYLILAALWSQLAVAQSHHPAVPTATSVAPAHPEARPFVPDASAMADVDAAVLRANSSGKRALIVFGANWCHDSRALAGWFATPRFASMLQSRYELVYVDVGFKDRNIDVARRIGFKTIKGTPTVAILSGKGTLLNKKDAAKWRDTASRTEQDVYRHFAEFTAP
jgi:thioredoxin-like negative regulator of GroEL